MYKRIIENFLKNAEGHKVSANTPEASSCLATMPSAGRARSYLDHYQRVHQPHMVCTSLPTKLSLVNKDGIVTTFQIV